MPINMGNTACSVTGWDISVTSKNGTWYQFGDPPPPQKKREKIIH